MGSEFCIKSLLSRTFGFCKTNSCVCSINRLVASGIIYSWRPDEYIGELRAGAVGNSRRGRVHEN